MEHSMFFFENQFSFYFFFMSEKQVCYKEKYGLRWYQTYQPWMNHGEVYVEGNSPFKAMEQHAKDVGNEFFVAEGGCNKKGELFYRYASTPTWEEFKDMVYDKHPNATTRFYFEVIRDNKPCLLYADIEWEKDLHPRTTEEVVEGVRKWMTRAFIEDYRIALRESDMIFLTAENAKKGSLHLIIRPVLFFAHNKHMDTFIKRWAGKMIQECDSTMFYLKPNAKGEKQPVTVFDLSVYSSNRVMRMLGCSKPNAPERFFRPYYPADVALQDTLVTLVPHPHGGLVDEEYIHILEEKKTRAVRRTRRVLGTSPMPSSGDDVIDDVVHLINTTIHPVAHPTQMGPDTWRLDRTDFTYKCGFGEMHQSNSCFVTIVDNFVYYHCFSNKCKGKQRFLSLATPPTLSSIPESDIHHVNKRYLAEDDIPASDTVIIRSPMNTGKTTIMTSFIAKKNPRRILVVTCRCTLASYMMSQLKKLGFIDYRSYREYDDIRCVDRLVVQLESLYRLEGCEKYDMIILDEIESLLYQFKSKTMNGKVIKTYEILSSLVTEAAIVWGLDGHAYERTIDFFVRARRTPVMVWNHFKNDPNVYYVVGQGRLVLQLHHGLKSNKVLGVASNSKKFIKSMHKVAIDICGEEDTIAYYQEVSDDIKKSLDNCEEEWMSKRCVLYSPTIGPGVNFDPVEAHFDELLVYIVGGSSTYREALQQIARIRALRSNTIYIAFCAPIPVHPLPDTYERVSASREEELAFMSKVGQEYLQHLTGMDRGGQFWKRVHPNILSLALYNRLEENLSFNNMKNLMLSGISERGGRVFFFTHSEQEELPDIDDSQLIVDAPDTDPSILKQLQLDRELTQQDMYALLKYELRTFYGLAGVNLAFVRLFYENTMRYRFDFFCLLAGDLTEYITSQYHEIHLFSHTPEFIRVITVSRMLKVLGFSTIWSTDNPPLDIDHEQIELFYAHTPFGELRTLFPVLNKYTPPPKNPNSDANDKAGQFIRMVRKVLFSTCNIKINPIKKRRYHDIDRMCLLDEVGMRELAIERKRCELDEANKAANQYYPSTQQELRNTTRAHRDKVRTQLQYLERHMPQNLKRRWSDLYVCRSSLNWQ